MLIYVKVGLVCYRVYFGEEGDNIVLLLCGGDKSSQTQDIEAAKAYWKEHLSHA
jgi:putative addiction module killer protein